MRTIVALAFLSIALLSNTAHGQDEAPLEKIIEVHVKALGGKEAISKIENVKRSAEVSLTTNYGPMTGTAEEVIDIKGKRLYTTIDLGQFKRTEAMAGGAGWFEATDGDGEMDDKSLQLAKMSLGVSPLLTAWETSKDSMEVKGKELFNGKKCHKISFGSEVEYFVDPETGLLNGINLPSIGKMTMSNHKAFGGVKMPKTRGLDIDAQGVKILYRFKSTETNVEIDDALFGDLIDEEESSEPVYSADQIMNFLDKDGDERISMEEAKASPELSPAFGYVDTNKDGFIDMGETKAMVEYSKQNQKPATKKPASNKSSTTGEEIIALMDKNRDGSIDKKEANAELQPFFDDYDKDGNGQINEEEARAIAEFVNSNR